MWAQLLKMTVRSGHEDELLNLSKTWEREVGNSSDSGWLRTQILRSEERPEEVYLLVYFESEEKARANEATSRHQELTGQIADLAEGVPEFVDLIPVDDSSRS